MTQRTYDERIDELTKKQEQLEAQKKALIKKQNEGHVCSANLAFQTIEFLL